jgi:hypothetical protein
LLRAEGEGCIDGEDAEKRLGFAATARCRPRIRKKDGKAEALLVQSQETLDYFEM